MFNRDFNGVFFNAVYLSRYNKQLFNNYKIFYFKNLPKFSKPQIKRNLLFFFDSSFKKFKPDFGTRYFLSSGKYNFHNFTLRFTAFGFNILGKKI